jgi:hypothetical protein
MMDDQKAVQWLEVAYNRWLFGCDYNSNLRKPTKDIVLQMHLAVGNGSPAKAEQYMERLQSLSTRFSQNQAGNSREYSYELAETLVECGCAAYRMGEKLTSLHLFDDAAKKFTSKDHCRATVLWMLGSVQWQFQTKLDDAIVSWESSYQIFCNLLKNCNRPENAAWYRYWVKKMRAALDGSIIRDYQAPPPQDDWPSWDNLLKPQKTTMDETAAANHVHQSSTADVLRAFSVYTSIPAGGFSTSPHPATWLEMEQVLIDGVPHNVFSLNQGRVVKLGDNEHYVAVKVKGDSMNKKRVDDGDYVLLHVQQAAENGDIVAAEMDGGFPDDEKSTLKQYFRRDGKVYLEPQSSNTTHQPFIFSNEKSLHIRGIAIAVLKKQSN